MIVGVILVLAQLGVSQPATTQPATTQADPGLQVLSLEKPADSAVITRDGDAVTIEITSISGIGGLGIRRTAAEWPKQVRLVFQYGPGRRFQMLESFGARVLDEKGNLLWTTPDGKWDPSKPIVVSVPASAAAGVSMRIGWIDAYRR